MPNVEIILKTIDQTKKGTQGATNNLKDLAKIATPVGIALVAIGKAFMFVSNEAAKAAQVDAKLNAVLKATGGAAGMSAGQIDAMSTSMMKLTGVDDEAIKSGAAVMATFREIGGQVFPQAIQAALDMSAVMGQDLQSSIVQIGKALNEPIQGVSALRRVGVQLTDQQKDQIQTFMASGDVMSAQAVILKELQMEFGGAAKEIHDAGTQVDTLKNSFGNWAEAVGSNTLPALAKLNTELAKFLDHQTEIITENKRVTKEIDALMEAGQKVIGTYDEWSQRITGQTENYGDARVSIINYRKALQEAGAVVLTNADALRENTFTTETNTTAIMMNEEAINAMSEANQNFVSVLGGVVSENQTYNKTMQELRVTQNEFIAEKAKLISQGYGAESSAIQDVNGKLAENEGKMAENKAAHKAWTDAKIGDLLLQQLSIGGLEKAELSYYLSYMTKTGQMTKADEEMTQKIMSDAESIGEAYDEQGNAVYHVGERSLDAADKMVSLTEKQAELAAGIRKNALPMAAALARALASIPAEVRSYVELTINTIRMNSGPVGSGGLGGLNIGSGLGANAPINIPHAEGGRITDGAIHIVGDSPGGGMTPYTEAIYNGEVFDAKETRKLYEAGMLDGATRLAGGTTGGRSMTSYRGTGSRGGRQAPASNRRPRSSGTSVTALSGGVGGGSLAEEAAVTAADVAQEATTVAASSLMAAESISNNVQQGSQATVAATVSTSGEVVAAIQETNRLLRRLDRTTHDSQYEQQLNI